MKLSPSTIAANLSAAAAAEAEAAQANSNQPATSMAISSSSSLSNQNPATSANIQNINQHHQSTSGTLNTGTLAAIGNSSLPTSQSQTQPIGGGGGQNMNQTNQQSSISKMSPKDSQVVAAILKEMGITEYEPRVLPQLVEFAYRYVSRVLEDAQLFSSYAKKKVIDTDDASLAIQMQIDRSFVGPPSRDILLEISRNKNTQPLPPIKSHNGLRLPADRYSLVAANYRLTMKNRSNNQNSSGTLTNKPTVVRSVTSLLPGNSFMNSKLSLTGSPINSANNQKNNIVSSNQPNDVFGSKRKLEET